MARSSERTAKYAQKVIDSADIVREAMVHRQCSWRDGVVLLSSYTEARPPVKKIALAILLSLSAFACAKENPNPSDYTINIHVSASEMLTAIGSGSLQKLTVVIDGKKYELEGTAGGQFLLALGDYKAKIVTDEHRGAYDLLRVYEFLFPDQKTRKFAVVGVTE